MNIIEGHCIAPEGRFVLLLSRFNDFIVKNLLQGALDTLQQHGVKKSDIDIIRVPGAFELPIAARKIASSDEYCAIIALGVIIRGGTPHFDYVAGSCVNGLSQIALEYEIPIALGVLTVDSIEQAIERAGTKMGNKGSDAAITALEMAHLFETLSNKCL
jgi:6,7-dimethyl-8-ribityllumazine synthase